MALVGRSIGASQVTGVNIGASETQNAGPTLIDAVATVVGVGSLVATGTVLDVTDAVATIAGAGALTATANIQTQITAAATISGSGSLTAYAISNLVDVQRVYRLVAFGSDSVYVSEGG